VEIPIKNTGSLLSTGTTAFNRVFLSPEWIMETIENAGQLGGNFGYRAYQIRKTQSQTQNRRIPT
jgi:hypothetical protein